MDVESWVPLPCLQMGERQNSKATEQDAFHEEEMDLDT